MAGSCKNYMVSSMQFNSCEEFCNLLLMWISSLEEFPSTLPSALNRLEATLAMFDAELAVISECYQNIDSSRKGPYRAIQLVSI